MNIIDFIEKLQRKPKQVRIQILWLAVFISMTVIFSFWLISFKYSLKRTNLENRLLPGEISKPIEEMNFQKIPTIKNMGAGLKSLLEEPNNQTPFEREESSQESPLEENIDLPKEIPATKLPFNSEQ